MDTGHLCTIWHQLSLESKVTVLAAIVTAGASCVAAAVTIFIARRYSKLKVDATVSIEESTEDEISECGSSGGKTSPCGLSIEIVNDGLCKIKTMFAAEYRYSRLRKFLKRGGFHSISFGFEHVMVSSGDKERLIISNQDASSLIYWIFKYGGKGKLRIEYSQLGSNRIRYAPIDVSPIIMDYKKILSDFPKNNYCIGNIGRLVELLVAEINPSEDTSIPKDDYLSGYPNEIMSKLLECTKTAEGMTATLYDDSSFRPICSNSDYCLDPRRYRSIITRHCTLGKYKACALQLAYSFQNNGLTDVHSLFTPPQTKRYEPEMKMKEGVAKRICNALNEWVDWHQTAGVHYMPYDYGSTITAPLRLSLLEREEGLPPE